MMRAMKGIAVILGAVVVAGALVVAQKPAEKVDLVAVVGCLKQGAGNSWTLANATAPMASTANAPSPKEIASWPRAGTHEFQLIGVAAFNLPAHRDHLVVVKGLHIKASPRARLNVTSVTMVAASCDIKQGA